MARFAVALKEEMQRVARKATKGEVSIARKAAARHRRDLAALKRSVADLVRRVAYLEAQEKRRASIRPGKSKEAEQVRFSPRWVKAHREKLGLSALDYGKLVGVSGLTIYNWESGKARPREAMLAALADVRGLRKREALRRLEMIEA
ncbi:MAG: helix-turn-helix transcriptional regulator [Planctomycetes bacterium]|nr:helix-turn-helix transcriptional regulator [Planctomycetota bacterium]